MIEKGKVYQISNGSLKPKNAQFNRTEHDYELALSKQTQLHELDEDES